MEILIPIIYKVTKIIREKNQFNALKKDLSLKPDVSKVLEENYLRNTRVDKTLSNRTQQHRTFPQYKT